MSAFKETSEILGNWRERLVEQDLASETALQQTKLFEQVDTHMKEAMLNATPGENFTETQSKWYDENIPKLVDGIKDRRVRERVKATSYNYRNTFINQANNFDFQLYKQDKFDKINETVNSLIGQTTTSQDPDTFFKTAVVPTLEELKKSLPGSLQGAEFQDKIAPLVGSYIQTKMDIADRKYLSNQLNDEQVILERDNIIKELSTDPFFSKMDSQVKAGILKAVGADTERYLERAKEKKRNNLNSQFEGYVMSVQKGGKADPAFEDAVIEANLNSSNFEEVKAEVEALRKTTDYYAALSNGDYKKSKAIIAQLADEASKVDPNNYLEFEKTQKALQSAVTMATSTAEGIKKNFAETIKNQPEVEIARKQRALYGPSANKLYANVIVGKAVDNDIPIQAITLLDDAEISVIADRVISMPGPDSAKAILELQKQWNFKLNDPEATNAWEVVARQIASSDKMPKSMAGALSYVNKPDLFFSMVEASKSMNVAGKTDEYIATARVLGNISKTEDIQDIRTKVMSSSALKNLMNSVSYDPKSNAVASSQVEAWKDLVVSKLATNQGLRLSEVPSYIDSQIGNLYTFANSSPGMFSFGSQTNADSSGVRVRIPKAVTINGEQVNLNTDRIKNVINNSGKRPLLRDSALRRLLPEISSKKEIDDEDIIGKIKVQGPTGAKEKITFDMILNSRIVTNKDETGIEFQVPLGQGNAIRYYSLTDNKGRKLTVPFTEIQGPKFQDASFSIQKTMNRNMERASAIASNITPEKVMQGMAEAANDIMREVRIGVSKDAVAKEIGPASAEKMKNNPGVTTMMRQGNKTYLYSYNAKKKRFEKEEYREE